MNAFRMCRPIVLALALLAIPTAATASDWTWKLTPYAWLLDASVDVQVNDREIFSGEIDFKDLIDDTDFAFFAHLEGRRGKLGLFASAVISDLGDEPRNFSLGPVPITAKADPELTIIDVGGVWYPSEDGGFGIHYGGVSVFGACTPMTGSSERGRTEKD